MDLNILVIYFAGVLTFLAPCSLSTLPIFFTLILSRFDSDQVKKGKLTLAVALYSAGFLFIYVLLGLTATGIGKFLFTNSDLLLNISAIFFLIFGLVITFGDKFPVLFSTQRTLKVDYTNKVNNPYLLAFILGITTAFAWTPCIGPILGAVLTLASNSSTILTGAGMLFVFGMGIVTPLFIITFLFERFNKHMSFLNRVGDKIYKISGYLLIILGLLILTGGLQWLHGVLFDIFSVFGFVGI